MLKRLDINGNPYLGVFCRSSDRLAILTSEASEEVGAELQEALGVPAVRTTLGGSKVVGALCTLNSSGLVVGDLATETELSEIRLAAPGTSILRLAGKLNAIGNNLLVNDRAALVHPDLSNAALRKLAGFLGVEVARGTIAGMKTVGSAAAVTNRGALCHPRATAAERKLLAELFRLPVTVGTANYGSPMIGACVVANSSGAATGLQSTGIEMGRIEEALGFL